MTGKSFQHRHEQHSYSFDLQAGRRQGWEQCGSGVYWRGYAFYQGDLLESATLSELLMAVDSDQAFGQFLRQLNGCFSLLWETEKGLRVAVDIGRTIPVFWKEEDGKLMVKDQLSPKAAAFSEWKEMNWFARCEFIPGNQTIWQEWQQLRAGEWLSWDGKQSQIRTYYTHHRPQPLPANRQELANRFNEIIDEIFDRFIHWAAGRPIVVLLSGGYDSRFILAALKKKQYPNLLAVTYGRPESWEVQVARQICEALHVPWHFVDYQPELINSFLDKEWAQFADYAGNGIALPQEQDFFALQALSQSATLPADSIICPGYCGDFQAGSYHPGKYFDHFGRGLGALQDMLLYRFDRRPDSGNRQKVLANLGGVDPANSENLISELEDWVLREYVSKYILNGVRAYEWWGYHWHLPLWDHAFIEFWQEVPNEFRQDMSLFRETLESRFFQPMGLQFPHDQRQPARSWYQNYLPIPWKHRLKQWRPKKPVSNSNGLHLLIPAIQGYLGWPTTDPTRPVNEMVGWWYLAKLDKANKESS